MSLPTWVSKKNLALHIVLGVLLAVVLTYLGTPPLGCLMAALVVGLAKEQAEENWSDFRVANGGPLNGVLDVATIVAGSALYLLWTALT